MNRYFRAVITFAVMMIFSASMAEAVTFTNASLTGSYSFMLNARTPDSTVTQSAVLGLATFDGAGNVSANYVSFQRPPGGPTTTSNVTLSGTYTVGADGSGLITFTGGLKVALRLDASTAGTARGVQMLLVTPNPDATVNSGIAVQQSPLPKTYKLANLKGKFSYLQNRWTASIAAGAGAAVGILNFDGKGHVANDSIGMIAATGPITSSVSGTYTVNADGTGTITYTGGGTFDFVITGNGKQIQSLLATSTPGDFLVSQTAVKQ
jgi:hypothetical protein